MGTYGDTNNTPNFGKPPDMVLEHGMGEILNPGPKDLVDMVVTRGS